MLGLLFLSLALVVALPGAMAGDGYDQIGGGFGFGQRIAGTYLVTEGTFTGSLTLHADGNVTAMSSACCGDANNVQSEAFGNWVRTGPYQITLRTVAILTGYNFADPDPHGPTGNIIAAPTEVLDFAPDFQTYTGSLCTQLWFYPLGVLPPDIDDVDPDLTIPFGDVAGAKLDVYYACD